MWGNFGQNPLNSPIIAHRNLSLEMFEGKRSRSILKIWV